MVLTEYGKTKVPDSPLYPEYDSIQHFLSIVSIDESGIFELPNLNFSKQYKLSDINFLGVTQNEQMAIVTWFSKVLETIPCRFSYIVANEHVNEEDFKKKILYPLADDSLDRLRTAFNEVIAEKVSDARQGLYQSIYITLTVKADDIKDAKTMFNSMDTAIRAAFMELSIDGMTGSIMKPLSVNERMQLLYNFTHVGLKTKYKFDFDEEISNCRDWVNTIAPASLRFENDMFYMNGKVGKVIYIKDYPKNLETDMISRLAAINCTSFISVNNELLTTNGLKKELARKHMKVGMKIQNEKTRNRHQNDYFADASAALTDANNKIEAFEREIVGEDQHYFNTTIMMLFMADNVEQLASIENKIESQAAMKSIEFDTCFARQKEGINSVIGLGIQEFKHVCNLSSTAVAMFIPYKTQELNDKGGVWRGINQLSSNAIYADKKLLKNRNTLVGGQSGSGKSAAMKLEMLISYLVYVQDRFMIIDPNADYTDIARILDGTVISFDPQKRIYINPLDVDFTGVEYSDLESVIYEKADFIQTLISSCIKRDLSEEELPVLNSAIEKVYNDNYSVRRRLNGLGAEDTEYVIPKHMKSDAAVGNEAYTELSPEEQVRQYSPTLQDIYQALMDMNDPHATRVARMMDTFVNGSLSLFNHRTNVDLNNRFIVFDLNNPQENLKVTSMVVMMEFLKNNIKKNGNDGIWTHVYIDEFHELLGIESVAKYAVKLWKEVRKMSGLVTGITQNMTDLMKSSDDYSLSQIFANTETFCFMSQSTQDKEILMKYLPDISPALFAYVDHSEPGTGLLKMGAITVPFDMRISKSSYIYKLINTDAGIKKGA